MKAKVNAGRPMYKIMGNVGSSKGGSSSDNEKWLDSRYKLKEPTEFLTLEMSSKERNKS